MYRISLPATSPEEGDWREFDYEGKPPGLSVRVELASDGDSVKVGRVWIERTDGRAVTAKNLREVKLPAPTRDLAGGTAAGTCEGLARNRRLSRTRDDDRQHRAVWDLWQQALRVAPRAPTQWTMRHLGVSEATARRWTKQARERAASQGWAHASTGDT